MKVSGHIQRTLLRRIVSLPEPMLRLLAGPRSLSPDGLVLDKEAQLLLSLARLVGHRDSSQLGVQGARDEMERSLPIVDFRGIPARIVD